jgi:tetratricopeptide (TPR) repeat protein
LKKELKREIKEDEFATWLEKVIAWGEGHRDEVRIGVGVGAVLLAAFGALTYFQSHRAREADRAFQEALSAFEAPVAAELPPQADRPEGQVFATAEDKYKTAAAAFEGAARRYGSSDVGPRANYYAALSRIQLGQYAEAEKTLRELQAATGGGAGLIPELARMALGGLYRESGEIDRAVETYRGVISNPDAQLPRDYALSCLANTLEDAGRYAEARAAWKELVELFPASVYAPTARARADYLASAPVKQG